MTAKLSGFDQKIIAEVMTGPLQSAIASMGNVSFSKPPEFSEHNLIEYASRMRVFGLEKFGLPCYISYVNFFLSPEASKKDMPVGTLIIFIEHNNATRLLKSLGYPNINEDEEGTILEKAGEFCVAMANQFKTSIASNGYKELTVSTPLTFKNDIPEGVPFDYNEKKYYQLDLFFWKQKTLIFNLTLGAVPLK
jgi:hypothetical protein